MSFHQTLSKTVVASLGSIETILNKTHAFTIDIGCEESAVLNARLYPNMFSFCRQIQVSCDLARRGMERLAGLEPSSVEDKETSTEELLARVATTQKLIAGLKENQFDPNRPIELTLRGNKMNFTSESYMLSFLFPNLYFHVTAAYAIARHNGVPLGKADYLSSYMQAFG